MKRTLTIGFAAGFVACAPSMQDSSPLVATPAHGQLIHASHQENVGDGLNIDSTFALHEDGELHVEVEMQQRWAAASPTCRQATYFLIDADHRVLEHAESPQVCVSFTGAEARHRREKTTKESFVVNFSPDAIENATGLSVVHHLPEEHAHDELEEHLTASRGYYRLNM